MQVNHKGKMEIRCVGKNFYTEDGKENDRWKPCGAYWPITRYNITQEEPK